MHPYRQNQCGGAHPDAKMMAMHQQLQQCLYYQQQQTQGMWNPGAHQRYSGVNPSMHNPNFIAQQYRYFGHGGDGVHEYQQRQQLGPGNNVNLTSPQRPEWAESRPGRTPCKKSWWSHVVSQIRFVDSPRGIDLDVEDEHANVPEELKQIGSKAATRMDKEAEAAAPCFVGTFENPKGSDEVPGFAPAPVLVSGPAAAAGGWQQKGAGVPFLGMANPRPPYAQQQQQPAQAQASPRSRTNGVPPQRQQQLQRHLCRVNHDPASKGKGNSHSANGAGSRATSESSLPEATGRPEGDLLGDTGTIEGKLCRQAVDNAEGKEREKAARKQLQSVQPHSKDKPGGVKGMQPTMHKRQSENESSAGGAQQEQGKGTSKSINSHHCGIVEHQGSPKLSQAARKPTRRRYRPHNNYFDMRRPNDVNGNDGKENGGDNSDEYSSGSGSGGSCSSSSPGSDSDDDDDDDGDSDSSYSGGSDTDDEAEYSTMRRNSQSGIGGQSTLEYSAFHDALGAHARNFITSSENHSAGRHSIGGLLGAGVGGRFLYPEASASNVPGDGLLVSTLGHPQQATMPDAGVRYNVLGSFSLARCMAHALSANAVSTPSNSVTMPSNSATMATDLDDLDKQGYEIGTLTVEDTVLKQANQTPPVGTTGGTFSRRTSIQPRTATTRTPTKSTPPASARKEEKSPTRPRQVVGVHKPMPHPLVVPGTSSGTGATKAVSKTAETSLPKVRSGTEREHLKGSDALAKRCVTKRVSKDSGSSTVVSLKCKGESTLPVPSDRQRTASATKDRKSEKVASPVTRVVLATAAKEASAHVKTNAATTTAAPKGATATVIPTTLAETNPRPAPPLPLISSTQHGSSVPTNSLGPVQALKSHGKQGVTPPNIDKTKAAATVVTSQSSVESHQPSSEKTPIVAPHFATNQTLPTNAGGAVWVAAAAAAVAGLKPAAQLSPSSLHRPTASPSLGGRAPVRPAAQAPAVATPPLPTATSKIPADLKRVGAAAAVSSATPSDAAVPIIDSNGRHPHRVPAPLLGPATASAAPAHHRPQPQRPKNGALKNPGTAKNARGTTVSEAAASEMPPNKSAGWAPESSVTPGAPKKPSTVLRTNLTPVKPTVATATATTSSAARGATAPVTARSPPLVNGTSITTATVEDLATPSGTETPLTTASSAAEQPPANGVSKTAAVRASGNSLKHSASVSPRMGSSAPDSFTKDRLPPAMSVAASQASSTPSSHSNLQSAINGDDDGGVWPGDPFNYYGYSESDLPDSNNHYAINSSQPKLPAGNHAVHKYSMVGSPPVSPLIPSSTAGKADVSSHIGARRWLSGDADVLEEIGYLYY
ncbi:hypothetical protein Q4I30_003544 [Leishmania utingensis]|uniref:Uncharacterized protein n=1 Tax=Leishmania utingensis TaxID=653362 RepID=A0AAW3AKR2_9TRYP